jgi:hypothetical protein
MEFKVGNKAHLDSDLTIVESSADNSSKGGASALDDFRDNGVPMLLLYSERENFPVRLDDIATNISNILNGNEVVPLKTDGIRMFFERKEDGFDLRYQEIGMHITEPACRVRLHLPEGNYEEIANHIRSCFDPNSEGNGASMLCDNIEVIENDFKVKSKRDFSPN